MGDECWAVIDPIRGLMPETIRRHFDDAREAFEPVAERWHAAQGRGYEIRRVRVVVMTAELERAMGEPG